MLSLGKLGCLQVGSQMSHLQGGGQTVQLINNFVYIQLISDRYLYCHFSNTVTLLLNTLYEAQQNVTVACSCDLMAQ